MEPISQGSSGPAVEDVQRRLEALGFSCGSDDPGVFDAGTSAAVRTFQQRRGLTADGVVGDDTWRTIVAAGFELGDRLLLETRPMMRGDDVRELQRRLNRLGFDAGYDDGIYGPETAHAVREFQLNVGLQPDGMVGHDTIAALRSLHRQHQEAPAFVVRERATLRDGRASAVVGARVLIDPAHGPDDPGVHGRDGVPEHRITWRIANRLVGRLAALGAHPLLSRGPQTTPTPSERAARANREEVEVILSIHLNGLSSPAARGAAAYYFGQERYVSERGRALARLALDNIVARTGTDDCRTHPSTTALLRESRAPAVIVEAGFLSHPDEGPRLATADYQAVVAGALSDAVVGFLLGRTPTGGRTPATETVPESVPAPAT